MLYIAMIFENFFVGKLRGFAVFQILCVCGIIALSGCGTAQGDAEQGWVAPEIYSPELVTTYTFTFHNFTTREVLSIAEVMEREFSGFVRARSPEGNSSAFKYGYVTKASGNELYRWVNLLLMDMGLDPDRQVKVTKRDTKIEIDKLFTHIAPTPVSPAPISPSLVTTYTFTFRNFTTREVLSITEVMEREFSGFVRARSPEGNSSAFKYGYVTKASGNELYRWVNLLLMNMGLDPDRQVKFTERGTKIEIDKLFDGPSRQSQTKNCRYC